MSDLADDIATELDAMWRFAIRLTANESDAEDLVQRTCIKALESLDGYQAQGKLRSWLFQIEHRVWLNLVRQRKIRSMYSLRSVESEGTGATLHNDWQGAVDSQTPEYLLQLHEVAILVDSLPETQRVVILLVCVEGFTYEEAAGILEVPVGTIMSRLARARMSLGKQVSNPAIEDGQRTSRGSVLC